MIVHRTNFDCASFDIRDLCRIRRGLFHRINVNQIETGKLFLGFRERPIRNLQLAASVSQAHGSRG
ncbi:MAG: hypothetical protein ACI9UU_003111 [Candidatus Azotimanducaceae bacterium]|jgi:hypothetical protein